MIMHRVLYHQNSRPGSRHIIAPAWSPEDVGSFTSSNRCAARVIICGRYWFENVSCRWNVECVWRKKRVFRKRLSPLARHNIYTGTLIIIRITSSPRILPVELSITITPYIIEIQSSEVLVDCKQTNDNKISARQNTVYYHKKCADNLSSAVCLYDLYINSVQWSARDRSFLR